MDRRRTTDKTLIQRIAVAIGIVAIGCSLAIFLVARENQQRNDRNACAINQFVDVQKQRTIRLKFPGYEETLREMTKLQEALQPPLAECAKILR